LKPTTHALSSSAAGLTTLAALAALVASGLAGMLTLSCGDPVHDDLVASLGPESSKVGPGPLHRPGQPCMACHGGRGPAKSAFSVAGTIFTLPTATDPLAGVVVNLSDSYKKTFTTHTNSAGNFMVHADEYTPGYPLNVSLTYGGATKAMTSHIGRDGSCAGCHHDPVGTLSPGHVYFADSADTLPAAP
jgi:hypothetical protein